MTDLLLIGGPLLVIVLIVCAIIVAHRDRAAVTAAGASDLRPRSPSHRWSTAIDSVDLQQRLLDANDRIIDLSRQVAEITCESRNHEEAAGKAVVHLREAGELIEGQRQVIGILRAELQVARHVIEAAKDAAEEPGNDLNVWALKTNLKVYSKTMQELGERAYRFQ